eukprot:744387-Pleurochrysis_carterae.AAC.2
MITNALGVPRLQFVTLADCGVRGTATGLARRPRSLEESIVLHIQGQTRLMTSSSMRGALRLVLVQLLSSQTSTMHLVAFPSTVIQPGFIACAQGRPDLRAHFISKSRFSHTMSEYRHQAHSRAGELFMTTTASETSSSTLNKTFEAHDFLNLWYPACFAAQLSSTSPTLVQIFERDLVLFKDADGTVRCLKDECPHRLAPLSTGDWRRMRGANQLMHA